MVGLLSLLCMKLSLPLSNTSDWRLFLCERVTYCIELEIEPQMSIKAFCQATQIQ
jgi:hypothetical protein